MNISSNVINNKTETNAPQTRTDLPNYLNFLKKDGLGVEIGVLKGEFSELILDESPLRRLFSIDPWLHYENDYVDINNVEQKTHNHRYVETVSRLARFANRSVVLRMESIEASNMFETESLDFIFIDGNHSYEAVKKDLCNWYRCLKYGGLMAGHDYLTDSLYVNGEHVEFGVKKAVDEFIQNYPLNVNLNILDYFTPEDVKNAPGGCLNVQQFPTWYFIK